MKSRSVREEPDPQRLSGVMAGGPLRDCSFDLFDMQKKRREEGELVTKIKERSQIFESLQQRRDELHVEIKKARDLHSSFDTFLKDEVADQAAEKAEKEKKEVIQLEAELERLKLVYAELMEMKQEQQRQIQRHSVYKDFMVRVVTMTKFDDVQELTGHIESLLHFEDHFYKREMKAHEQVDQLKESLLTLEDDHRLLRLQKNNQLSQLQTEMEKTCSEALSWERKWNHIQETAAKKTLLLARIKVATLNLYEMTGGMVEGDEPVNLNDTEKQLDKVKMFIQDHEGILKQYQTPSQKHHGQEKDKSKPIKHISTCASQDASI
ncbi:coiled-coil domain-containing protein 42 like-2 [Anarrhichthys ocellatus]|uniref:coiled-coil domain-containing protein 42 like-2 n=1 Tax=Anarrhichthys ocellatus TaxID=433405 RepID=UPI0012ED3A57|nr:cilia- and flagella-associated protein 73 [Anarrhichthys ocellatus]